MNVNRYGWSSEFLCGSISTELFLGKRGRERTQIGNVTDIGRSQKNWVPILISTFNQFYDFVNHLVFLDFVSLIYKLKGHK